MPKQFHLLFLFFNCLTSLALVLNLILKVNNRFYREKSMISLVFSNGTSGFGLCFCWIDIESISNSIADSFKSSHGIYISECILIACESCEWEVRWRLGDLY